MALFLGLYVIGILLGLAASIALDVQLHRPGIRQAIGLVVLGFLLWGAVSLTNVGLSDLLLPAVWAGTGLLAGLGSRGLQSGI